MNGSETLELRDGAKRWATVTFHSDRRITLDHELTEYEAKTCPGLGLYDAQGHQVEFQPDGATLVLTWPDGRTRALSFDRTQDPTSMEIADIVDPKALLRLYVRPIGLGAKTPISLTLNFRWVGPPPKPIYRP